MHACGSYLPGTLLFQNVAARMDIPETPDATSLVDQILGKWKAERRQARQYRRRYRKHKVDNKHKDSQLKVSLKQVQI